MIAAATRALLLLALAPQDVGHWIERLSDADPDARDEAALRLKAAGDAAIPALKRAMEGADSEVVRRAKDLVAYLDRTRRAREILATGPAFSIEVPKEKPLSLGELLARIGKHFGTPVDVADAARERPWSGAIAGAKLLQALDRITREAGLAYAVVPGRVQVMEGKPHRGPADYPGSFKVSVSDVTTTRRSDFEKATTRVQFAVEALHQSAVVTVPASALRLTQVEYDTGEVVKIGAGDEKERERYRYDARDFCRLGVLLPDPPAAARSIRSLKGELVVRAPALYDSWTFDRLEAGAEVEGAGAKARIVSLDRGEREGLAHVTLFLSVRGPGFGEKRMNGIGEMGRVLLLSKEGEEAPVPINAVPRLLWTGYSGEFTQVEARFLLPKDSPFKPARAVLKVAREYETVELPFELKEIPFR